MPKNQYSVVLPDQPIFVISAIWASKAACLFFLKFLQDVKHNNIVDNF